MKQKILITGGAGYIGSILVPFLLESGFNVTVVDNFMYQQSSLNQLCRFGNFNIIRGDIRRNEVIVPLLRDADIIIPLAAYVGAPLCNADPIGAQSVNVDAIQLMLSKLSSEQMIIMPTTNSAYGTGDKDNYCTEESILNPISKYAIDKVEVEKRLMEHKNSISLRLATVFGMSPRMRLDLLVNDFTYRAINDKFLVLFEGHFKRNFIHVYDVARVFKFCIENFSAMKGNIYNVGLSDANLSKIELCEILKSLIPNFYFINAEIGRDPDQRNYIVSNKKIEAAGFTTTVSIDLGIKELIKGLPMIKNRVHSNI